MIMGKFWEWQREKKVLLAASWRLGDSDAHRQRCLPIALQADGYYAGRDINVTLRFNF
jgi:hypothetical protein